MSIKAFSDYLSLEKKYSPHTVVAYKKDLETLQEYVLREYHYSSIDNLNYPVIRSWIVSLVDSGMSNRSINRKVSSLKTYYKFLQKIGKIDLSPLAKHHALKTTQKVQVPFSEKEVEGVGELLEQDDSFEGVRNRLMVEIFYSTGIRRSELVNIKMMDISLSQKTLKVLGKRNKERIIPLLPFVFESLTEYLASREKLDKIVDREYLFLTLKGVKIYDSLVYRVINSYFALVSEKMKTSPHILRHSFATHLLNEGADINSVKELLGHSSLASTQGYAKNSIARLKEIHGKFHPRN